MSNVFGKKRTIASSGVFGRKGAKPSQRGMGRKGGASGGARMVGGIGPMGSSLRPRHVAAPARSYGGRVVM